MNLVFGLCDIYFACSEALAYYITNDYILYVHRYWM